MGKVEPDKKFPFWPVKGEKKRTRVYLGDGLSDAPAPGPRGPSASELIEWARKRRRADEAQEDVPCATCFGIHGNPPCPGTDSAPVPDEFDIGGTP